MGPVAAPPDRASARELAGARAEGYRLLGRLVTEGIGPETIELAALSPKLAPLLALVRLESLAADHCHVFDVSAPPLEGLVVDPEGRIGGLAGERVRALLRRAGARVEPADEPEHLGAQLRAMADLAAAEAAARGDGREARSTSARMLDHLLDWVVPYEAAVIRAGRAFPSALLAHIVELAVDHRAALAGAAAAVAPPLPWSPFDLDDPDTDLRAIATFLARPAASGLILTRDDITALGRGARVPRGFGSRAQMVENLLRSAAELGHLADVAAGLRALADAHAEHLDARLAPLGALAQRSLARWTRKLTCTRDVLERLAREAPPKDAP